MVKIHLYPLTIFFLFACSTFATTKNELDNVPIRFFGLFAADHLISGIVDDGQSLEIAEPYEYTPYFATVMKAAMLNNSALNGVPLIQELQQNLADFQRNMMAVMGGPAQYENFCLTAIDKLEVGKRILLPYGFRSLGAHAMLMEVRKLHASQVQIVIYNTGTASDYHPAIFLQGNYKILPFVLTKPVSMKELMESRFFYHIVELNVPPSRDADYYCGKEPYLLVYSRFELLDAAFPPEKYIQPQTSSNCAVAVLLAFLHTHLDLATYETILMEMKLLFMENKLFQNGPLNSKLWTEIFMRVTEMLARNVVKNTKLLGKDLHRIQNIYDELKIREQAIYKKEFAGFKFEAPIHRKDILEGLENAFPSISLDFPTISFSQIKSLEELQQYAESLSKFVSSPRPAAAQYTFLVPILEMARSFVLKNVANENERILLNLKKVLLSLFRLEFTVPDDFYRYFLIACKLKIIALASLTLEELQMSLSDSMKLVHRRNPTTSPRWSNMGISLFDDYGFPSIRKEVDWAFSKLDVVYAFEPIFAANRSAEFPDFLEAWDHHFCQSDDYKEEILVFYQAAQEFVSSSKRDQFKKATVENLRKMYLLAGTFDNDPRITKMKLPVYFKYMRDIAFLFFSSHSANRYEIFKRFEKMKYAEADLLQFEIGSYIPKSTFSIVSLAFGESKYLEFQSISLFKFADLETALQSQKLPSYSSEMRILTSQNHLADYFVSYYSHKTLAIFTLKDLWTIHSILNSDLAFSLNNNSPYFFYLYKTLVEISSNSAERLKGTVIQVSSDAKFVSAFDVYAFFMYQRIYVLEILDGLSGQPSLTTIFANTAHSKIVEVRKELVSMLKSAANQNDSDQVVHYLSSLLIISFFQRRALTNQDLLLIYAANQKRKETFSPKHIFPFCMANRFEIYTAIVMNRVADFFQQSPALFFEDLNNFDLQIPSELLEFRGVDLASCKAEFQFPVYKVTCPNLKNFKWKLIENSGKPSKINLDQSSFLFRKFSDHLNADNFDLLPNFKTGLIDVAPVLDSESHFFSIKPNGAFYFGQDTNEWSLLANKEDKFPIEGKALIFENSTAYKIIYMNLLGLESKFLVFTVLKSNVSEIYWGDNLEYKVLINETIGLNRYSPFVVVESNKSRKIIFLTMFDVNPNFLHFHVMNLDVNNNIFAKEDSDKQLAAYFYMESHSFRKSLYHLSSLSHQESLKFSFFNSSKPSEKRFFLFISSKPSEERFFLSVYQAFLVNENGIVNGYHQDMWVNSQAVMGLRRDFHKIPRYIRLVQTENNVDWQISRFQEMFVLVFKPNSTLSKSERKALHCDVSQNTKVYIDLPEYEEHMCNSQEVLDFVYNAYNAKSSQVDFASISRRLRPNIQELSQIYFPVLDSIAKGEKIQLIETLAIDISGSNNAVIRFASSIWIKALLLQKGGNSDLVKKYADKDIYYEKIKPILNRMHKEWSAVSHEEGKLNPPAYIKDSALLDEKQLLKPLIKVAKPEEHQQLKLNILELISKINALESKFFVLEESALKSEIKIITKSIAQTSAELIELLKIDSTEAKAGLIAQDWEITQDFDFLISSFSKRSFSSYENALPFHSDSQIINIDKKLANFLVLKTSEQFGNSLIRLKSKSKNLKKIDCMQEGIRNIELFKQTPDSLLALILVFEYKSKLRLRKLQFEDLIKSVSAKGSVMFQRVMNYGKTFVLGTILTMAFADGDHLSVLLVPQALLSTTFKDMLRRTLDFFGRKGRLLKMERSESFVKQPYLLWLLHTLYLTVAKREYLITTPETILTFHNKYIELIANFQVAKRKNDVDLVKDLQSKIELLRDILLFFKSTTKAIIDEIDMSVNPLIVLNFPFSEQQSLHPSSIETVGELFYRLASDAEINNSIGLTKIVNNRVKNYTSIYEKICNVANSILLERFGIKDLTIQADPKDVNQENYEAFEIYLCLRNVVKYHLNEALSKNVNEHFGFSLKNFPEIQYSKPFKAANLPNENANFSELLVLMTKSFMTFFQLKLNDKQLQLFISDQQLKAFNEGKDSIGNTTVSKNFQLCFQLQLSSVNFGSESDLNHLKKVFNSFSQCSLMYLKDFAVTYAFRSLHIYDQQISSNHQNLMSSFKSFVGYSASIESEKILADGTEAILDKAVYENVEMKLKEIKEMTIFESPTAYEILSNVVPKLHANQKSDLHALLDAGAIFKGIENVEVAKSILRWVKESKQENIKAVLYFQMGYENNQYKDELMFIMEDEKPKKVSGTSKASIRESTNLDLNNIFLFLDQSHCTGVDIKLPRNSIGVLLVSDSMTTRDLFQSALRMRGLLSNKHQLLIALSKEFHDHLEKYSGNENLVHNFLHICQENSVRKEGTAVVAATSQKSWDVVRSAVLNKMLTSEIDETMGLFESFYEVFVQKLSISETDKYKKGKHTIIDSKFVNKHQRLFSQYGIDVASIEKDCLAKEKCSLNIVSSSEPEMLQEQMILQQQEAQELVSLKKDNFMQNATAWDFLDNWVKNLEDQRPFAGIQTNDFYQIKEVISYIPALSSLGEIFDSSLVCSSNFALKSDRNVVLLTKYSNYPFNAIIVKKHGSPKNDFWVILPEHDYFARFLGQQPVSNSRNFDFWLVDLYGSPSYLSEFKVDLVDSNKLHTLLTQALFLNGALDVLQHEFWYPFASAWFSSNPIKITEFMTLSMNQKYLDIFYKSKLGSEMKPRKNLLQDSMVGLSYGYISLWKEDYSEAQRFLSGRLPKNDNEMSLLMGLFGYVLGQFGNDAPDWILELMSKIFKDFSQTSISLDSLINSLAKYHLGSISQKFLEQFRSLLSNLSPDLLLHFFKNLMLKFVKSTSADAVFQLIQLLGEAKLDRGDIEKLIANFHFLPHVLDKVKEKLMNTVLSTENYALAFLQQSIK